MLWAIAVVVVIGLILIYGIKDLLFTLAGLGLILDELWKKRSTVEKVVIGVGALVVWPVGLIGLVLWLIARSFMREIDRELDRKYGRPNLAQPKIAGEVKAPDSAPVGGGSTQGVEGRAHE